MEAFFLANVTLKLVSNKTGNESLNRKLNTRYFLLVVVLTIRLSLYFAFLGRLQARTSFSMLLQLNLHIILVMADNFNSMIHIVIIWQLGHRLFSSAKRQKKSDQWHWKGCIAYIITSTTLFYEWKLKAMIIASFRSLFTDLAKNNLNSSQVSNWVLPSRSKEF